VKEKRSLRKTLRGKMSIRRGGGEGERFPARGRRLMTKRLLAEKGVGAFLPKEGGKHQG